MSNLRQNLTEYELEALRNEKPLILSVSLDFQTALKLNEMFERDESKIDKFINDMIVRELGITISETNDYFGSDEIYCNWYECPNCNHDVRHSNYCDSCGYKLHWAK